MLNLTEEAKLGIASGALGILLLMIICMACKIRRLRNAPVYNDEAINVKTKKNPSKQHPKCDDCQMEKMPEVILPLKVRSGSFMNPKREKGMVKFTLEYHEEFQKLLVTLIQGVNVVGRDFWDTVDCYVTLNIEPEFSEEHKTKVVKRKLHPDFNETFEFSVEFAALKEKTLVMTVWEIDKYTRHHVIGHVREKLDHVVKVNHVYGVDRQIKEHRTDQIQLGEILFSLCYLPTAERLTIVIMKARNLNPPYEQWRSGPRPLNPFVKVVLLFDGHKIKKKKTSSRHQDRNPVYNDAMMFDIPIQLLHRIIFVLSVADKMAGNTRSDVIGRVVIGSPTIGEALSHWQQMLVSPRRPIAAWHRLTM
ncbi:synaptotagmin-1 [Exaiptasia diaphana]|uniref:C2 domain-containing protein n=1 Tax=Exaiptasia diaphana TaxID=2652724 RepID=A0A913XIW5_EXADI|nr:synaptotagmin-1 [Exaiptasia diaphana]KXJ11752.1 Synaptotagmin-1 [Exaiptasia diaphana]